MPVFAKSGSECFHGRAPQITLTPFFMALDSLSVYVDGAPQIMFE